MMGVASLDPSYGHYGHLTELITVHTITRLRITFDAGKDRINTIKHGVSLAKAGKFEWDTAMTWLDARRNYGEARMVGIGYIGQRLYHVAFVEREDKLHIISLRKANNREVRRHAETQIGDHFPNTGRRCRHNGSSTG